MRVAAHESEQRDVVHVRTVLVTKPHLPGHTEREEAGSQRLTLWLAHANVRANRERSDKLGQPKREALRFQPSRLKEKAADAGVEVVRFLHVADVPRPRDHSKFRIRNCGMKLFGDTQRAASIAFTPKKQRRNLDGG